ncbi:MAG TPA: hypothetical protein PL110_04865 [Candidatus Eremiobacteraeota bacterium]|nr:MAG: hypothetical protein BWY64_01062 [bacterium ADurb.Bin363]HPZ07421.1 hypothetical protein [Candidatus Eremiobacteraeota bacterium]
MKENEVKVNFNDLGKHIEEAIESLTHKKLAAGEFFDPSKLETRLSFNQISKDNWQIIVEVLDTENKQSYEIIKEISI